jgi:hypothetical protein
MSRAEMWVGVGLVDLVIAQVLYRWTGSWVLGFALAYVADLAVFIVFCAVLVVIDRWGDGPEA